MKSKGRKHAEKFPENPQLPERLRMPGDPRPISSLDMLRAEGTYDWASIRGHLNAKPGCNSPLDPEQVYKDAMLELAEQEAKSLASGRKSEAAGKRRGDDRKAQKEKDYARYQEEIRKHNLNHPENSYPTAVNRVAEKLNVSIWTIKRATADLRWS